MVMNKKGQAFLMAAIIIAGLVLSSFKIANTAKPGSDSNAFYDLTEEVNFETKKVLDYGVINPNDLKFGTLSSPGNPPGFDDADIRAFLSTYNDYISGEEVLFIWGDINGNFKSITYQTNPVTGLVSLFTGTLPISAPIQLTTTTSAEVIFGPTGGVVTVRIRGIDYNFNLTPPPTQNNQQYIYFVLINDENNEKFVAKR